MHSIDVFIQNYFSLARTPFLTEAMYVFTGFFNLTPYSFSVFIFITFLIYLVRGARFSSLFALSIFVSSVLVYLMKNFFDVSRPSDSVMAVFGQSFPSFHATIATVFFIMLMYIFDDHLKSFVRFFFNFFCILAIFTMAFSRIYLGAHWFSDVFFGVVIGAVLSYFFIIIFRLVMNGHPPTSMLK